MIRKMRVISKMIETIVLWVVVVSVILTCQRGVKVWKRVPRMIKGVVSQLLWDGVKYNFAKVIGG